MEEGDSDKHQDDIIDFRLERLKRWRSGKGKGIASFTLRSMFESLRNSQSPRDTSNIYDIKDYQKKPPTDNV